MESTVIDEERLLRIEQEVAFVKAQCARHETWLTNGEPFLGHDVRFELIGQALADILSAFGLKVLSLPRSSSTDVPNRVDECDNELPF